MEVKLSRSLSVMVFDAKMQISRPQKRPDLMAILYRAQENRKGTNAVDLRKHLLNGRPDRVGQTLLKRCEDLGLLQRCDEEDGEKAYNELPSPKALFVLTPEGEETIREQEVFMPEAGRFRVWVTDDPLLEANRLIYINPVREENPAWKGSDKEKDTLTDLPPLITDLQGNVVVVLGYDHVQQRVRIDEISRQGIKVDSKVSVMADWIVSDTAVPSLSVRGKPELFSAQSAKRELEMFELNIRLPPPQYPWETVWNQLLGKSIHEWVKGSRGNVLLTDFADSSLSDKEKLTMKRTLKFRKPSFHELGSFDDTQVDGIPLAPRTDKDAREWAEWMLEQMVVHHIQGEEFQELVREVQELFPDNKLILPDQPTLARRIAERERILNKESGTPKLPSVYWFLQASIDLTEEM